MNMREAVDNSRKGMIWRSLVAYLGGVGLIVGERLTEEKIGEVLLRPNQNQNLRLMK